MNGQILIAAELKELLDDDPIPGCEVVWLPGAEPTPSGEFVALVPLLSRPVGPTELDGMPGLRIVANCAVGYDNVDLDAAAERGVVVTNTPDVLTDATADLTWALILTVARRLAEGWQLLREGKWQGWHPTELLGLELRGATLGVLGAGRIGRAVGERAVGFGLRVLYSDPARSEAFEERTGAEQVAVGELLEQSDIVTVHVPSTASTKNMCNAALFARMKRGALFINTARGDLVDETALLAALDSGQLGGAGLDVFQREPPADLTLARHPKVTALPHIGSATTTTRTAMARLAVENVKAVLAGRSPLTPVSAAGAR
jgi:glyoxylate reductase